MRQKLKAIGLCKFKECIHRLEGSNLDLVQTDLSAQECSNSHTGRSEHTSMVRGQILFDVRIGRTATRFLFVLFLVLCPSNIKGHIRMGTHLQCALMTTL